MKRDRDQIKICNSTRHHEFKKILGSKLGCEFQVFVVEIFSGLFWIRCNNNLYWTIKISRVDILFVGCYKKLTFYSRCLLVTYFNLLRMGNLKLTWTNNLDSPDQHDHSICKIYALNGSPEPLETMTSIMLIHGLHREKQGLYRGMAVLPIDPGSRLWENKTLAHFSLLGVGNSLPSIHYKQGLEEDYSQRL